MLFRCLDQALAPENALTMEIQCCAQFLSFCGIMSLLVAAAITCFPACQCPLLRLKWDGGKMRVSLTSLCQMATNFRLGCYGGVDDLALFISVFIYLKKWRDFFFFFSFDLEFPETQAPQSRAGASLS